MSAPSGSDRAVDVTDLSPLLKFSVTSDGGLSCFACHYASATAEVRVPVGYRGMLAWLVRIAENHNREVHGDQPVR